MREKVTVELILEATQPIAHGESNDGNFTTLRRRKMQASDGSFVEVPYVSGNSLRHHLRERGSFALLQAAGLLDDPQLTEQAQRLLFNGGMVSGSSKALKISEWNELRELLPHIALLGGCVSNSVREGTVEADSAILVCEETAPFLPEWVGDYLRERGRRLAAEADSITIEERARHTLENKPQMMRLLSSGARADAEERAQKRETASRTKNDADKLAAKSDAMIYSYEAVCTGSWWYWRVSAWVHSEIERDAFAVMVSAYLADPIMGGKVKNGNGRLRVIEARGNVRPAERADHGETLMAEGITSPEIARYVAHVSERRERIVEWLASVVA